MFQPRFLRHPENENNSAPVENNPETDADVEEDLQSANKSLLDTLRLAFVIMVVMMGILAVVFVVSGIFVVKEGDAAIKLRFGEIQRDSEGQIKIYRAGMHWAWPEPIDKKINVSLAKNQLVMNESFWFELQNDEVTMSLDELGPTMNGIRPGRDGAILTGDQGIAHMRITVQYQVDPANPDSVALFARNVAEDLPADTRARSELFITTAIERAVILTSSGMESQDVWAIERFEAQRGREDVRSLAQKELNRMQTGLRITDLTITKTTPPRNVREAYLLSNEARSTRVRMVEEARQYRNNQLNQVSGEAHNALLLMIDWLRLAEEHENQEILKQVDRTLKATYLREVTAEDALNELWPVVSDFVKESRSLDDREILRLERRVKAAAVPTLVGGEAAETMNQARRYRNEAHQELKRELEIIQPWLKQIEKDPTIKSVLFQQRMQQALETIFSSPQVEIFQLPYDDNKDLEMIIKPSPQQREARQKALEEQLQREQQ